MFGMALHPYIVGQPHRLRQLRRAVAHIVERAEQSGPQPPEPLLNIFSLLFFSFSLLLLSPPLLFFSTSPLSSAWCLVLPGELIWLPPAALRSACVGREGVAGGEGRR